MKKITKADLSCCWSRNKIFACNKAIPKEMLPIIDKPLIEYAVEEAVMAGIKEIIFITSHTKRSIEDHFDQNIELEENYLSQAKKDAIKKINRDIFQDVTFTYVRQKSQKGLGHAILQAKHLIGDEFFAILLADDLVINNPSATKQLIDISLKTHSSVIGLNKVPAEHISRYGVISSTDVSNEKKLFLLDGIIEKPHLNPPSDMAVFGRYVLSHHIFNYLEIIDPGVAGEIQLTDAIKLMLKDHDINGYLYDGIKFDCGSKEGYVKAITHLASDLLNK
jgi:UTP--glucose-1-phosphate uridylyltransferase